MLNSVKKKKKKEREGIVISYYGEKKAWSQREREEGKVKGERRLATDDDTKITVTNERREQKGRGAEGSLN